MLILDGNKKLFSPMIALDVENEKRTTTISTNEISSDLATGSLQSLPSKTDVSKKKSPSEAAPQKSLAARLPDKEGGAMDVCGLQYLSSGRILSSQGSQPIRVNPTSDTMKQLMLPDSVSQEENRARKEASSDYNDPAQTLRESLDLDSNDDQNENEVYTGQQKMDTCGGLAEYIGESDEEIEIEIIDETSVNHELTPAYAKKKLIDAIQREDPFRDGHLSFSEMRDIQLAPLETKAALIKHFDQCLVEKDEVNWVFVRAMLQDEDDSLVRSVEDALGSSSDEGTTIHSGSTFLDSGDPRETEFDEESFGSGFSLEARSTLCESSVTGFESDESEYEEEIIEDCDDCMLAVADTALRKSEVIDSRYEWLARQRRGRNMRELVRQSTKG